ncbi:MAG TPA: AraC family transcriptional regulator [Steroidobacteraceae bacterium]|nr:AraC family transcriptional regulator [Steroidobacteraceae bacterium]
MISLATTSDQYGSHLAAAGFELTQFDVKPRPEVAREAPEEGREASAWPSWAEDGLGLFVVDIQRPGDIFIQACARQDVLCFGVLLASQLPQRYALNDTTMSVADSGLALTYQEAGSSVAMATHTGKSFRSISVAVSPAQFTRLLGRQSPDLPADVRRLLARCQTELLSYRPSFRVQRLAEEILAHRNDSRTLSSLYLKGKSYELLYTILDVLRAREATTERDPISSRDVERVHRIRALLDEQIASNRTVDELARLASMNRTKLRFAFKHLYGVTISEYRNTLRMQKADDLLRTTDTPAAVIAYQLGYNGASSFSVAYKRFFGHCLNKVRAR